MSCRCVRLPICPLFLSIFVHFGVFVIGVDIVSVTCLFKVFCLNADVCGGCYYSFIRGGSIQI